MKYTPIVFLLCFNLYCLSLFHSGDCLRFFRRESVRDETHAALPPKRSGLTRQAPFITSVLAGPLALATFLFALPLLPSLVMAPLALAGIPSALNVLTSLMSSFTNGKPLNSILSSLSDPLHMSPGTSDDPLDESGTKPTNSLTQQINALKSIAKMFRSAIIRRNTVQKNVVPVSEVVPDKITEELGELGELLPNLNITTNATTNGSLPVAEMEKSIRAMDAVFTSLRDVYSVIRHGLRRYEITDSDCQSRIVCEIHQKVISRNKMLKSFSLNAIDVLSLEKQVDSWSTLNDKSKRTIKFYINAAKTGFADKDCTKEYDNCPTLNTRSQVLTNFLFARRHMRAH